MTNDDVAKHFWRKWKQRKRKQRRTSLQWGAIYPRLDFSEIVNEERSLLIRFAYRAEILSALSSCDHVIIFNQLTPIQLITSLKPDIITKGGDYKKKNVVGYNEIKKWQGQVHIINYTKDKSSTGILEKLI